MSICLDGRHAKDKDVFEASNDHTGITSGSNEIWSK